MWKWAQHEFNVDETRNTVNLEFHGSHSGWLKGKWQFNRTYTTLVKYTTVLPLRLKQEGEQSSAKKHNRYHYSQRLTWAVWMLSLRGNIGFLAAVDGEDEESAATAALTAVVEGTAAISFRGRTFTRIGEPKNNTYPLSLLKDEYIRRVYIMYI